MRKIYVRNYLVFIALLILFAGWLLFSAYSQLAAVEDNNRRIAFTTKVIFSDYKLVSELEELLSSQRSYLVSGDNFYLNQIEIREAKIMRTLNNLQESVSHKKMQYEVLDDIELNIQKIRNLIDRQNETNGVTRKDALSNLQELDRIAHNINQINQDLLNKEHELLNLRVSRLLATNSNFIQAFLIGGAVFLLILLFFNSYILKSQFERLEAAEELELIRQRLDLAYEAMNEGVFDWDIEKDEVFYSERFTDMLGYSQSEFEFTYEQFRSLLHPDDVEAVESIVQAYLRREINEYSAVFRMKHKNGNWIWINSRAKALFNEKSKPIRMTGSHRDITDAREIEQHLIEATKRAEKANLAKSEFLAHMSHEIRTPLTAVTGIAEILDSQSEEFPPTKKKLIKTLLNSSESLKDLINDVLDISKIEADEIKIAKSNFPLSEMFYNISNMMEVKAQEKNIGFEFEFDEFQDKIFYGDRVRIRQILVNLIGNAIKFTDKGHVRIVPSIRKSKKSAELIIEVHDTGIGISQKNQKQIFSKFKQADSSASRKYGGTGLGLHISHELAKMMEGTINVKSQPKKGSVFTLCLPYKASDMQKLEQKAAKEAKAHDTNSKKPLKALIAEDYEANILVVDHILQNMNVTYDHAVNGLEALEKFKKRKYDFVLMDIQMPEMDGLRATIEIRKHEKKKGVAETPVIAMTAHALTSEREKCFQIGMNEFITKPIDTRELKSKIRTVLKDMKKAA